MIPYLLTNNSVTVYLSGKPLIASKDHPNWPKIVSKLKNEDTNGLADLFDVIKTINSSNLDIRIEANKLFYKGIEIHNSIVSRIIRMIKDGFDVNFMILFLENLLQNPNENSIKELYDFMEHGNLPITTDGYLLAYKKVRSNYMDIHSGLFDNSIGKTLKMNRDSVDNNKDRTCSFGLHFCSYEYLKEFANSKDNRVLVLKINPKDVVSIPTDYNNTKGRCCKYEVLEDITENYYKNILKHTTKLEDKAVYKTEEENLIDDYLSSFDFIKDNEI